MGGERDLASYHLVQDIMVLQQDIMALQQDIMVLQQHVFWSCP